MKNDPSQTKVVVILLLILVIAAVAIVVRLKPAENTAAVVTPEAAAPQAEAETVTISPVLQVSRNPFRMPEVIARAVLDEGMESQSSPQTDPIEPSGIVRPRRRVNVDPMFIGKLPSTFKQRPGVSGVEAVERPIPSFELLATVAGPDGYTAVISDGGPGSKVVAVGDALEGGFRVRKLEEGRAVLSDGRDTVVIKRPRS